MQPRIISASISRAAASSAPSVTSVVPNSGSGVAFSTYTVTVHGANLTNDLAIVCNRGGTATWTLNTFNDSTSVSFDVDLSLGESAGLADVVYSNSIGSGTLTNGFTYTIP